MPSASTYTLDSSQPGIQKSYENFVHNYWNKFFLCSCLFSFFVDPFFFFLLNVNKDNKCIEFDETLKTILFVLRSLGDLNYFLNILNQIILAYVAPESDDLVDHPEWRARNYLFGYFAIDFSLALPVIQVYIWLVEEKLKGSSGANLAKKALVYAFLIQYIPRLLRILPMLAGRSERGFIFESGWTNFVVNLLTFVLSGHVVGSCWYLLGLQRVNQCLRDACGVSSCMKFIDCGQGGNTTERFKNDLVRWQNWTNNTKASACFGTEGDFQYGIYKSTLNLTTNSDLFTKYIYSLFWGLQQISTLAGNQTPSYYNGEILFTIAIIGLGLFLLALLIGNMQNFLQALGRRRLDMYIRRRDFKQWMKHRRLPLKLRSQIRKAERDKWAATRGVNESELLKNLPVDLQGDIRPHLQIEISS